MVSTLSQMQETQSQMANTLTQIASSFSQVVNLLEEQSQELQDMTATLNSVLSVLENQQEILKVMNRSLLLPARPANDYSEISSQGSLLDITQSILQIVPFHLVYAVIWTQMVKVGQFSKIDLMVLLTFFLVGMTTREALEVQVVSTGWVLTKFTA